LGQPIGWQNSRVLLKIVIKPNECFDTLLEKHNIPLSLFSEAFSDETVALMNGDCLS
jgi:hypothetical protein